MTPAEADILATLRRLCGDRERTLTTAEIAADARCSTRTVKRALQSLVSSGMLIKSGHERHAQSFRVVTETTRFGSVSPRSRREPVKVAWPGEAPKDGEDCCDGWGRESACEGDEYNPLSKIDAARADRAKLMADKAWRPRTVWARRGDDANQ